MLFAYFLYFEVYLKKMHLLLGMEAPLNSLPDNLVKKYNLIVKTFAKHNNVPIRIFKEGFCNAVAQYNENKIILGLNVLRDLTTEECMAVVAHEFGHLNDRRTLAAKRRNVYLCDFLLFLYCIVSPIKTSFFPLLGLALILGALSMHISVIKKITLKAEFNADSYVKNFDLSLYSHLKPAVEKIGKMNGIDKDHCKQTNASHLDIDERLQMVAQGKFNLQRKSGRGILIFFLSFFVFVAVHFVYLEYFLSESDQWENMREEFYQLSRGDNYDLMIKTITEALTFSREHFGKQHNNTFITLNDICEFYMSHAKWEQAEEYGLDAYEVGLSLYKERKMKLVECLNNLGEIYYHEGNYPEAENYFNLILQAQNSLKDDEPDVADTLDWLAFIYSKQEKRDKAIDYYNRALHIYENEGGEDERIAGILCDLGYLYIGQGELQKAIDMYQRGLTLEEKLYGKSHPYIIGMIRGLALANEKSGNWIQAKKLYQRVLHIKELSADHNVEPLVKCYKKLISLSEKLGDKDASAKLVKKMKALTKDAG